MADLKRRDEEAGFTPLNMSDISHSTTDDVEDFIAHYGKKGMRWGVRKQPVKTSSDYKKTAPYRNRNPKELTNRQLQDVNNRVNLETNYKRLHPSALNRGHNEAKIILGMLGTAAAFYKLSQSEFGQAAINSGKIFLKRNFGGAHL